MDDSKPGFPACVAGGLCSFVVRKLDRSQRRNWGGRGQGNKLGSKKCNPWERGCWKVSTIIIPQILNWAIALRKYSMLQVEWVKVVATWIVSLLKSFRCELDSAVLNEFAWNTRRVGYFLIEANGDVPLDGVAFSQRIDYNGVAFSIELLEWGRTFFGYLLA